MELLNKIQKELKVEKSHFNAFGEYNYRNAEDILEAVKPLLGEGTLTLSDEIVGIGDRTYVRATVTLRAPKTSKLTVTEMNQSGTAYETVSVTAYAREPLERKGMDESQITGAASSYARKYALNGLFCIDDTKDADTQDNSTKPAASKAKVGPPKRVADVQKAEIKALVDDKVLEPITLKEEYEAYVLEQTGMRLEPGNYTEIISRLKAL